MFRLYNKNILILENICPRLAVSRSRAVTLTSYIAWLVIIIRYTDIFQFTINSLIIIIINN